MTVDEIEKINWEKMRDLLPAIIQDASTNTVLMLGYMNPEALKQTLKTGLVTFYSRSKKRLWVKGETSGHALQVSKISLDCDQDALLVLAKPLGPVCHTGSWSCFDETERSELGFLTALESTIHDRKQNPPKGSYTAELFNRGIVRMAQKIGEEGVELALAAACGTDEEVCSEAADLLFHLLVLLAAKELSLLDVVQVLKARHQIPT